MTPQYQDLFQLTLFALRAAQRAHHGIQWYSVQRHKPSTLEQAARDLEQDVGATSVLIRGVVSGNTLHVSLEPAESAEDEERAAFERSAHASLSGTLTDFGSYSLDAVRVRVRAEDGEMEVPAIAFLTWSEDFGIDESMSVYAPDRRAPGSRVVDVLFGRHRLDGGVVVEAK